MKRFNTLLLAFSFSFMQLSASSLSEDELIMKAIYYTDSKSPQKGAKVWKELFESTNKEKYLVEYFYTSLQYKDIKDVIAELKVTLSKKKNKELYELLAGLYSKEGDTDGLLEVVKDTASIDDIDSMYEVAYLYTIKGKDKEALNIYQKIYSKEKSWESLKGQLSILAKQNKMDEASKLLWSAISSNPKLPKDALLVYIGLIDYKKETKNALFAFNKLYKLTNDKKYLKQLISLYLFNKDYDSIIQLLKKSRYDDKLLYELYLSKQNSVEAYKLLHEMYKKSKDPKWLAEKAILTFEIAHSFDAVDKRVINRVCELFDKALKEGATTPTYYNYYGYTLIENNIQLQKGLELVKKALLKEPDNVFYLDSLAWGYYKLKDCKKAKEIMLKIRKLNPKDLEEDILKHEKTINSCKEQ
jgi:predicted Zn-dependent protease